MMKNFASIKVLACGSKSIVFKIYPFNGHPYFKRYLLNINHIPNIGPSALHAFTLPTTYDKDTIVTLFNIEEA